MNRKRGGKTPPTKKPGFNRGFHSGKSQQIKLLVLDGDGTAYPFWYYFVPAMQEILPHLAEKIGVHRDEFSAEVGRVMYEHGTHEYPWTLELTRFRREFKGSAQEFRDQFVVPYWATMDRYRAKYLRTYPEVFETLTAVKQKRIHLAILSDAPFHMALLRSAGLQLSNVIDGVYALQTPEPELSTLVDPADIEFGRERVRSLCITPHNYSRTVELPKACEKPNPTGLRQVMSDFGVEPFQALYIGDSLPKDGGVAAAAGVPYIWARYGTYLPGEYEVMINRHLCPATGSVTTSGHGIVTSAKVLPPMIAQAASFAEVLNHLTVEPYSRTAGKLPMTTRRGFYKGPGH